MRKIALLFSLVILCGCAGYRVGHTLPANVKTVYVPTVINATDEPLVETAMTPAMQNELMTRTELKLIDTDQADTKLEVRVREYRLQSIGFVSSDNRSSRSREYRAWLTADAVLRDRKTGAIIAEAVKIQGKATFIIPDENAQGDIVAAKRSSLPKVCADLAREIADTVTEVWQ